jgi:hypothetical protein
MGGISRIPAAVDRYDWGYDSVFKLVVQYITDTGCSCPVHLVFREHPKLVPAMGVLAGISSKFSVLSSLFFGSNLKSISQPRFMLAACSALSVRRLALSSDGV